MLNLFVASININLLKGAKTHQPKLFNGTWVFAHSLVIESKQGLRVDCPAVGDFGK